MSDIPLSGLEKESFTKTSKYSWTSRRRGDLAEHQLPQAQEPFCPLPLTQIISPAGRNPISAWRNETGPVSEYRASFPERRR